MSRGLNYSATVAPPPMSFEAAMATAVPEREAREAFGVVRVVRQWEPSPEWDGRIVNKPITNLDDLDPQTVFNTIAEQKLGGDDSINIVLRYEGANVSQCYIRVLSALLAYRATNPGGDPLPMIWLVDPDMKPLPARWSKAYVWRYHLCIAGSMSANCLMGLANELKTRYGAATSS
jgi:hypothetical protein